jgi:sugar phosphate isomerase/epimerase
MFCNLSPATAAMAPQSLAQLIALATRFGFGGIDLPAAVLQTRETAVTAAQAMAAAGLRWGLFWLPCDISSATDAEFHAGMQTLQRQLPLIALTGCTRTYNHLWPGSHDCAYLANFRRHVARLKPLAELLGAYGIRLGLEFIGAKSLRDSFRYPFASTLAETLELADACGPTTGIVLDFFHWYCSGGTLEEVRRLLPVERIVNVHANDALAGRPRDAQTDTERALPLATGVIPARELIAWLQENGYDGPIIAEPFTPTTTRFATMTPAAIAQEVGDCLGRLVAHNDIR